MLKVANALDLATSNLSTRKIYTVGRISKEQRRNTISQIPRNIEFDSSLFQDLTGLSSKKDNKIIIDREFSGDLEYKMQNSDRNYNGIILKAHVVQVLKLMNRSDEFKSITGDKGFVYALLSKVFSKNELMSKNLDPEKLKFVKGK